MFVRVVYVYMLLRQKHDCEPKTDFATVLKILSRNAF